MKTEHPLFLKLLRSARYLFCSLSLSFLVCSRYCQERILLLRDHVFRLGTSDKHLGEQLRNAYVQSLIHQLSTEPRSLPVMIIVAVGYDYREQHPHSHDVLLQLTSALLVLTIPDEVSHISICLYLGVTDWRLDTL